MKPQIFILNGPPRSGKDSLANYLEEVYGFKHLKFANILKNMTHRLYGLNNVPIGWFEEVKDEPNKHFFGLTPRQAYIAVSEKYIKPVHGDNFFGHQLALDIANRQKDLNSKNIVVSDGGFYSELKSFTLILTAYYDISVVKLERKGCSFDNDSRDYIPDSDLISIGLEPAITLSNHESLDTFLTMAEKLLPLPSNLCTQTTP